MKTLSHLFSAIRLELYVPIAGLALFLGATYWGNQYLNRLFMFGSALTDNNFVANAVLMEKKNNKGETQQTLSATSLEFYRQSDTYVIKNPEISIYDNPTITIKADRGIYRSKQEEADLLDHVDIQSLDAEQGFRLHTQSVKITMGTKKMVAEHPVSIDSKKQKITASKMSYHYGDKVWEFSQFVGAAQP